MTIVTITDDTTREELAETLRLLCDAAKRAPAVLGKTGASRWDLAHQRLNVVLDEYERCPR